MAKKIDYNKEANYRYTSHEAKTDFHRTNSYYYFQPTTQLLKFNKYLVDLCNEHGIEAHYADPKIMDRTVVSKMNKKLCIKLDAIGVRYSEKWNQEHNRYKFDKDGNVIDRTTGKIVKKRTGENGN